jgi:phage terminase large subunit
MPLLAPARYKTAHGDRGSGKSYFFATAAVEACLLEHGTSVVCIREVQGVLAQSSIRMGRDRSYTPQKAKAGHA